MSYQQGFIDACTILWDASQNYSELKTFRDHCIEIVLKKAVMGKIESIKRDLGLANF